MVADPKKRAAEKAHIVLIDETGLLLNPLVRRTLAPRGETPLLIVPGAHRKRTSVIAALSLSPLTHQPGLYFQSLVNDYYNNLATSDFVRDLLRHLRGPVILVWDNGNNHKGPPIQKLLTDFPRLTIERLPPYAPDLNPVEQLWQHLKVGHLANYAAPDIQTLDDKALDFLATAKFDRERLLSCFKNTPLYKPLTGHRFPGSQ